MLVSIIITTYNRAEKLKNMALASAINQWTTFRDYEIIVVDDCSTDNTMDVVKEISSEFPEVPISYIKHETNKYVGAARNTGVKYARGEYIVFIDDDDIIMSNFLLVMTSFVTNFKDHFKDKLVVTGQRAIRRPSGSVKFYSLSDLNENTFYIPLDDGFLIKRSVFDEIQYDETVYNEDADFGIQYMRKFGYKSILLISNLVLVKSGHEIFPTDSQAVSSPKTLGWMEKYLEKNLPYYYERKDNKEDLEYIFRMAGRLNYLGGEYRRGFYYMLKAIFSRPLSVNIWYLLFMLGGPRFFRWNYKWYETIARRI